MKDHPWIIALIVIVVVIALIMILAFVLASTIVYGRRQTLEEALAWQREHCDIQWFRKERLQAYTIEGYRDYPLHAFLYPADTPTNRYIILTHGYTDNRYGNLKYMKAFLDMGYHCILYDLRGHGENSATFTTYGIVEAQDLCAVIEDTRKRYPELSTLGLFGESLGAASTLTAMKYEPKVDFAISDCAFADIDNVLAVGFRQMHLPLFLIGLASWGCKIRYGYSFREMRPIDALAECRVPILFLHGAKDWLIAPDNAKRLYETAKGEKELHFIEGAQHAESIIVNRPEYVSILEGFLTKLGYR